MRRNGGIMAVTRTRKLYIDGNTVYGIDEECRKRKGFRACDDEELRQVENYVSVLMNLFYFQDLK